eukprot:scaffold12489_cov137-Skeletonema_dohrnii-CCMP3373.AAC.2
MKGRGDKICWLNGGKMYRGINMNLTGQKGHGRTGQMDRGEMRTQHMQSFIFSAFPQKEKAQGAIISSHRPAALSSASIGRSIGR